MVSKYQRYFEVSEQNCFIIFRAMWVPRYVRECAPKSNPKKEKTIAGERKRERERKREKE